MTTRELWDSISGGKSVAQLTDKQRTFFLDLARAEKLFDVDNTSVRFPDGMIVRVRNCYFIRGAYGGGLGKVPVNGKFKAQVFYMVRFLDTGNTEFTSADERASLDRRGFRYEILKP